MNTTVAGVQVCASTQPVDRICQHGTAPNVECLERTDCLPAVCAWREEDPNGVTPGTYESACGEMWSFTDGGVKENHVRFCQGCGKPVSVIPFPAKDDAGVLGMDEARTRRIGGALRLVQEMWDELDHRKLNPTLMRQYADALSVLEDDFKAQLPDGVGGKS